MTLSPTWIGIDVSKAWIDVADPALGRHQRIANEPGALAAFAASLAGRITTVVFEATGSCDAALRNALAAAGVGQARVNPQRARDFARATGRLAKTDRIDAAMLAAMGQALKLQAETLPQEDREKLVRLTRRRDQLVAMRMQEKTRGADMLDGVIADDLDRHIAWLDKAVADVEAAMRRLVDACDALSATEATLRSMPGVDPSPQPSSSVSCPNSATAPASNWPCSQGSPHSTTTP